MAASVADADVDVDVSVDVQKRRQTLSIFAKSAAAPKENAKTKRGREREREAGGEIRALWREGEYRGQEEDGHYEITFNYSYCTATTPKARQRKLQKCMKEARSI